MSTTSSAVGIAVLGAGIFATEAYIPALAALGSAAPLLRATYSRSIKSAQDLSAAATGALKLSEPPAVYHDGDPQANLDALLARSDIHAVIIALPITRNPEIVSKCLAAGKHVLSEKPVAPDVEQGLKLIQLYRSQYQSKGLVWRIAENFEAEPIYRAARAAIRAGKIGKVVFFKANVVNYIDKTSKWYNTPWRTVPDYQGGFLLDGGVHTIAALRTILPEPLTHLSSFASLNKDYLKPHDTINAIAKSEHFHGIVELTFASPTKSTPLSDAIVVTGTEGWLAISKGSDGVQRITIKSVVKLEGKPDEEAEEIIEEKSRGIEAEFESFFGAIQGKKDVEALGEPEGALQDVAFIQAALTSQGSLVDLVELTRSAAPPAYAN